MSHEITQRANGFVEMAYYGDPAWHKLGNPLTLEEATNIGEDTLQKAGMEFLIERSRVRYGGAVGMPPLSELLLRGDTAEIAKWQKLLDSQRIMDDHHVLCRSDTKAPLAIVSPKFKIVQPREILMSFKDICASGGFTLSAAGTLFGGKRFWATASIGSSACILGRDEVKGYLLIVTACDGSMNTVGKLTAIRSVCNNTVSAALADGSKEIRFSHRTVFDPDSMKEQLGIVQGSFADFITASKRLACTTISKKEANEMTAKLLIDSRTVTKEDVTASSGFKNIISLFDHGKGNHGETLWDWTNGVTEYVDHMQRAKTPSHRMANSMFGKGDALKTMAFNRALELAD